MPLRYETVTVPTLYLRGDGATCPSANVECHGQGHGGMGGEHPHVIAKL